MGAHCRALQQSPEELLLTIIVPGGGLIGSWTGGGRRGSACGMKIAAPWEREELYYYYVRYAGTG